MNFKINTILRLLLVFTGLAGIAQQSLPLRKFREPGDSLDISIQQELDRAVDLGIGWIKTKQSLEGSWGVCSKLETTALCALALASQNDLTLSDTLQAAVQYIKRIPEDQSPTNFSAVAWSAAALRVTATTGCIAEQNCARLEKPEVPLSALDTILRREMLLGLCLLEPDEALLTASKEHYSSLARQLDTEGSAMLQMWLDARVINRVGEGQLLNTQGQRVDWRRIFARKIISTQKIDVIGGGFWPGVNDSMTLQNTALAILISKEL